MSTTRLRNSFEKKINKELEDSKVEFSYETIKIPYVLYGSYTPDFSIQPISGNQFILECKGHFRREDRRKLAAVKAQHPEIDLRILFYAYKLRDIRWAIKNSIPYAIGSIPEEWLTNVPLGKKLNAKNKEILCRTKSKKGLVGLRKQTE